MAVLVYQRITTICVRKRNCAGLASLSAREDRRESLPVSCGRKNMIGCVRKWGILLELVGVYSINEEGNPEHDNKI